MWSVSVSITLGIVFRPTPQQHRIVEVVGRMRQSSWRCEPANTQDVGKRMRRKSDLHVARSPVLAVRRQEREVEDLSRYEWLVNGHPYHDQHLAGRRISMANGKRNARILCIVVCDLNRCRISASARM